MADVIDEIRAERERQVSVEGWTPEHDDAHVGGEIAQAAASYAMYGDPPHVNAATIKRRIAARQMWPWSADWFKPRTERENLIRAGALIVAEIERIDRSRLSSSEMRGGETP